MNQIFIHKSREGVPWAAILDQERSGSVQNSSDQIVESDSAEHNNLGLKKAFTSTEDEIKLLNGKEIALSISHDGDYAVAIAMVAD